MKGRLEHELRTKNAINNLLKEMPKYVSEYYYNIQISKEPMTCLAYIRKIDHFLKFANMDITEIDDYVIGRYFDSINYTVDSYGNIKKTSLAHRKTVWSALNQFFSYLVKKRVIDSNPLDNTERPAKKDAIERKFLTMEDLNEILSAVKYGVGSGKARSRQKTWRERDFLIIFLFMTTGMREAALTEINVEDIDFDNKILTVTDKRNKVQKYHITDELERAIITWLEKREQLLGDIESDALFLSVYRERLCERAVSNIVEKYSREALGYSITPHKLRAAFVSLYYEESGGDLKATCEAVGHSDVSTTSIYITKRNDSRIAAQSFMSKNLNL